MAKKRYAGPPVILEEDLEVGIEITIANGGGSYTTTGVNADYPTIPAGTYSFGEFCTLLSQEIRQYIYDDFGDAGSSPTNGGTVEDIDLDLRLVPSTSAGASRVSFVATDLNALIGGNPAAITACILKNTASPGWPCLLGLGQEGDDVSATIAAGIATAAGQFQPRAWFCFLRSEVYIGPRKTTELYTAIPMGDGDVDIYEINSACAESEFSLITQEYKIAGDLRHIGTFKDLSGDRLTISLPNPKTTGRVQGISSPGFIEDRIPEGSYLALEGAGDFGWVGRVKDITVSSEGTDIEIELWDKVDSAFSTVKASSPIYWAPEAWAMRHEAKRLRTLLVYGADDSSGAGLWTWEAFAVGSLGASSFLEATERPDQRLDRYTMRIPLIRRLKSGLTLVTT